MTRSSPVGGIGLEYLSVFGMPLGEYVAVAARLGCDFVSVNFGGAANPLDDVKRESLRDSAEQRRKLVEALTTSGLRLELAEGFAIVADRSVEGHAADLDAVAELGARSICAVSMDKDMDRTTDEFARLAEMGAQRGLVVTTEVGAGVVRNFDVAADLWRTVAHPSFALLIDTMHFFRFGGQVADLAKVPAEAIGHVQLCDVPMPAQIESYMQEALFERRCPGDGDLPLGAFLQALSPAVPVGLEIPVRSEAEQGVDAETRMRRCVEAARALILA